MPSYISPGVYIVEQDFSLYVPNLSTTILALIGGAAMGPVNEAVQITSAVQFIQTFGEPTPNFYGPYAALQFLGEGQTLYYTRVTGASGLAALYQLVTADSTGVGSVVVDTPGTLYTSPPAVVFSGGGPGVGATATAQISGGAVITVTVTNPGYGYTSAPTPNLVGGGGSGAAAHSVLGATGDQAATIKGTVVGPYDIIVATNDSLIIDELDFTSGIIVKTSRTITLTAGPTETIANIISAITGTAGYAGWNLTAGNDGSGHLLLTHKTKDNLHGLQIKSTSTCQATLGLDGVMHFGSDVESLPATIIGSVTGLVNIIASVNDSLVIYEQDLRTGTLISTQRVISLTPGLNLTFQSIADIINAAALAGTFNLYASVQNGALVLTSGEQENELFSLKVDGSTAVALATANTLGLNSSMTFSGAKAKWLFEALSPGSWGNNINVNVSTGTNPGTFKVVVSFPVNGVLSAQETYDNLVIDPTSADYVMTRINTISSYITVTDNLSIANDPGLTGPSGANLLFGNDGLTDLGDADYIGFIQPDGSATGLQIFDNPEVLNINLVAVPGVSSGDVISAMIDLCVTRGDCMAIIDPPFGLSSQQVIDWHNGVGAYSDHEAFNSSYAALYWPWVQIFDPVNNIKVWTPPSGHISRIYAFTDRTTETWYAPAGLNRGHIIPAQAIEHSATKGERDFLEGNGNAVNPIINVQGSGATVWGQLTLQRAPTALDRVNVRRMLLYLEKVVATATNFLVFEPNDEILWAQFVDLVTPFMASVKARRGLIDFAVRCDATTNPPDAIDRNEMHAYILLKPTKAAEKIIVTFTLTSTGAAFSEIVSF